VCLYKQEIQLRKQNKKKNICVYPSVGLVSFRLLKTISLFYISQLILKKNHIKDLSTGHVIPIFLYNKTLCIIDVSIFNLLLKSFFFAFFKVDAFFCKKTKLL